MRTFGQPPDIGCAQVVSVVAEVDSTDNYDVVSEVYRAMKIRRRVRARGPDAGSWIEHPAVPVLNGPNSIYLSHVNEAVGFDRFAKERTMRSHDHVQHNREYGSPAKATPIINQHRL